MKWIDKTAGRFGQYRQGKRRARLSQDPPPMGYLREYLAFALAELGPVMPTRRQRSPRRRVLPRRR